MKRHFYFGAAILLSLTVGLASCGKSKDNTSTDESAIPSMYEIEDTFDMDPAILEEVAGTETYETGSRYSAGASSSSSSYGAASVEDFKDQAREGIDKTHDAIDDAADQLKEAGVDSRLVDKAAKDAHKAVDQSESALDEIDD